MACVSYNCDELGDHLLNDCEVNLQGGGDQIIVLDCGHTVTDPSNATQINDNIASGKAKLIKNVKVGLDAGSAVEVDALISCRPAVVVNYDRTMSLIDGNVNASNMSFYDTIFGGRGFGGLIINLCAADKVLFIDNAMNATGSLIVPNTESEFIRFEGTFKWKSKENPAIAEVPAGIFV